MEIDLRLAKRLADIQRRLLELETNPGTVEGILEDAARMVEADAAMAGWLNEGTPLLATWNAGPQIEEYFFRTFAGVDRDGNIRSTDPDLDSINLTRRQMGSGVYHESAFAGRAVIESAAFHREAFRPAGMNHVVGMTTRLAVGEAVFAMGYRSGKSPALVGGNAEIILNLLLPAFANTFEALDRQARNFERLQRAIAESDMDVSVQEGEEWSEGGTGAFLNLPLPGPDAAYLAISPPDAATLASRLAAKYGLTKRQEDITHCLLDGLSTKDAAARLGISPNTARRHCEAVLHRTGASRRGELNWLARSLVLRSPDQ
ncbi:helix-turn-helix transcriptional regulator [uncultured Roseovarius sp.]|uniref:response regulator transcription factor n=1 Tax=uncultured Roseovarius sp. TaxID=293344 RepID=UPI002631BA70|nr:helix-turn-helix transcriptional regulator [uncultured Roseovarius sp.]